MKKNIFENKNARLFLSERIVNIENNLEIDEKKKDFVTNGILMSSFLLILLISNLLGIDFLLTNLNFFLAFCIQIFVSITVFVGLATLFNSLLFKKLTYKKSKYFKTIFYSMSIIYSLKSFKKTRDQINELINSLNREELSVLNNTTDKYLNFQQTSLKNLKKIIDFDNLHNENYENLEFLHKVLSIRKEYLRKEIKNNGWVARMIFGRELGQLCEITNRINCINDSRNVNVTNINSKFENINKIQREI